MLFAGPVVIGVIVGLGFAGRGICWSHLRDTVATVVADR